MDIPDPCALTPGCRGVKKFLPTTGAAGKRTFQCGRPRCSARTSMTRRVAEKICTKKVCVDSLAPSLASKNAPNQAHFFVIYDLNSFPCFLLFLKCSTFCAPFGKGLAVDVFCVLVLSWQVAWNYFKFDAPQKYFRIIFDLL